MENHHFNGKSTISMAIFNCYVSSPEDNHDIPSVAASTLISPWWLSRSTKRERSATPRVPGPRSDSLVAPPKEGIALVDLIGWPRCGRQVHQEEPSAQDATNILFHWDPWPPKKMAQTREIMWMEEWYKQRKIGMNAILPDFMVVIWCFFCYFRDQTFGHNWFITVRPFWSLKGWRILDGNSRSHNSKKDHKPRTMPKVISRSFSMSSFGLSLWWSNKLPKKKRWDSLNESKWWINHPGKYDIIIVSKSRFLSSRLYCPSCLHPIHLCLWMQLLSTFYNANTLPRSEACLVRCKTPPPSAPAGAPSTSRSRPLRSLAKFSTGSCSVAPRRPSNRGDTSKPPEEVCSSRRASKRRSTFGKCGTRGRQCHAGVRTSMYECLAA